MFGASEAHVNCLDEVSPIGTGAYCGVPSSILIVDDAAARIPCTLELSPIPPPLSHAYLHSLTDGAGLDYRCHPR